MSYFFSTIRPFSITMIFMFLAACTQSGLKPDATSMNKIENQRSAKIQQARKRAAKNKAKRKAEFEKKRMAKRDAKKGKHKPKMVAKQRTKSKKGRTVSKIIKTKSKTYAYVGGRSKGIHKRAPWNCVPKRLKIVLNQVSKKFGRVIVNSTHRSRKRNRLVGGKRHSYHIGCRAVDFTVKGRTKGLTRWLAKHPLVGGYNRYPSGFYHIDTGPKRTW